MAVSLLVTGQWRVLSLLSPIFHVHESVEEYPTVVFI